MLEKKMDPWAGEIDQRLKHLPYKHEFLHESDAQYPCKTLGTMVYLCKHSVEKQRKEDLVNVATLGRRTNKSNDIQTHSLPHSHH